MTKTTTPRAPRLTKAQKLAKIELEAHPQQAETLEVVTTGDETPEVVTTGDETPEVVTAGDETPVDLVQVMTNLVTVKTIKKVKTVKTGVGAQILTLIAQGHLSNKEIVCKVLADNPLRKTTYACVAWYQSQVKAGKIDLPQVEEEFGE
jgi:hypothetical protein